jgi:type I restriction enzyme S subunit
MALGRKPIEIVKEGKHQLLAKAEHWGRIFIQDVAKIQNGYAFSSEYFTKVEGMPLIRIRDIENETTVDSFSGNFSKEFVVKRGDILIGMDGDFKVSRWKGMDALLNQRVCRIIPNSDNFDSKFLYICIQPYLDAIHAETSAVTVKHLSSKTIGEIPLPYPPLPEQQAIVAKIEELFSELENGKQQLLTAQEQLKVYRQSLLKWAFEGKLTYKKVKDGELPKGWKIVKLSDLGSWKGGGTPSKQVNKYWENGTNLWVTSKDMKIGVINDSINKITDEAILNSSANRIPKGAILFVMRSGILRHTFPVAIAGKDLTVNQDLQTLSPSGLATSEFIYWFIRAFNNDIRQKCSKDGTTVESIESSSLKNYPFILPPLQEQQLIVSELESKLTVCDKIEEIISHSLQQAETLKQSILKKAFNGSLI